MENPAEPPFIAMVIAGLTKLPDLLANELPLSETKDPVTLKEVPARGFSIIGSIAIVTGDLTVIVERIETDGLRSDDPL